MTHIENKQPRFAVNDEVFILLDTEIYDKQKWIKGKVEEVDDETISVKWDDLDYPEEYELSDLPDIRHNMPDEYKFTAEFLSDCRIKYALSKESSSQQNSEKDDEDDIYDAVRDFRKKTKLQKDLAKKSKFKYRHKKGG